MSEFEMPDKLQKHRPLLLACEAIGWLHMAGKAKADFLRQHGGQNIDYKYEKWFENESPPFPWDDLLKWVRTKHNLGDKCWPGTLTEFISKHKKKDAGLLGLLQAGHAMASSIEKNLPSETSKYLGQDITHMWLSSAFGHPTCNLLKDEDQPEILSDQGWIKLLDDIKKLLDELANLGNPTHPHTTDDLTGWWAWREEAIGRNGWLRKAFTSTLAETRLPNNDVTLFDQSYVAAALFKSAVAGAILEGKDFNWDNNLRQKTQWRLLTVGMAADYYESRSVKIGDWVGARKALDDFFEKVRKLIEVELAVGSLLYADSEVLVFSFPGECQENNKGDLKISDWQKEIENEIDKYAGDADFETPPYCNISEPSRSLVKMTKEIEEARKAMAVPLHRAWNIKEEGNKKGHICPVCLSRSNGDSTNKQKPCDVCVGRRKGRMNKWSEDKSDSNTIWITEVADSNDRLALITMSLDIEPWLSGDRLDALRAQAIAEWRKNNPVLNGKSNLIDQETPFNSLLQYIQNKLATFDPNDLVLSNLQEGYKHEKKKNAEERNDDEIWKDYFTKIVEDRADTLKWDELDDSSRARWLTHQFFRKLASTGRIYRFQRQAEEFFRELLIKFRELASSDENRQGTKRLIIKPEDGYSKGWTNKQVYNGRCGDAPISLLYREDLGGFITICNLERVKEDLKCKTITLVEEDKEGGKDEKRLTIDSIKEVDGHLGCYHPVIPLEVSPVRFRIIVPLETASACVDLAIQKWNKEFARVWDRMPLRIGVVAFKRLMPFQAVIEAARNIEQEFEKKTNREIEYELWRVDVCEKRDGVMAVSLVPLNNDHTGKSYLHTMPITLPDGREDVFYPYLAVEDTEARYSLDFQHPDGQVYRHVTDLKTGDGIYVHPAKVAAIFLDQAAKRYEPLAKRCLKDWPKMREIWDLLDRTAPSQTALRGVWSELMNKQESWRGADGEWLSGGKEAWLDLVRALLAKRLEVKGAELDTLVETAGNGLLKWCMEWHISVLKKQVSGGQDDRDNN